MHIADAGSTLQERPQRDSEGKGTETSRDSGEVSQDSQLRSYNRFYVQKVE